MRTTRFYSKETGKDFVAISDAQTRHMVKVLRLNIDDNIELFDGQGTIAAAVVTNVSRASVELKIQQRKTHKPRQSRRIIIASAIAKGPRFDWLISKCTELDVDRIVPVLFERTVKQAKGTEAITRYSELAIEAAKQCQRVFLPQIDKPCSLQQCLDNLRDDYPDARIVFGSLDDGAESITTIEMGNSDFITFIGPEGGLTEQEKNLLIQNDVQGVRLAFMHATRSLTFSSRCSPYSFQLTPSMPQARSLPSPL